ncbi:MAG TPA: PHP domain-containing protein [Tepidisphaeraceae bacterium]|jgi:hypothetical protein
MSLADLHCHSTASDGTLSPAALVEAAAAAGVRALALTDHDTVAGVAEAATAAGQLGIDFIPGIEISAEYPAPGTLHILGYGIDPRSENLTNLTATLRDGRDTRNPRIVAKLGEIGVAITMDEVQAAAGGDVIGRPHIAAVLLRKGYVSSIKQAFDKYLAQGAPAYFDKERLSPKRALAEIHAAGGVAVLAHPTQLRTGNSAELARAVKDLVDLGLAGIEVLHSDHTPSDVAAFEALARRFGLVATAGSDFHGGNKPSIGLGRAAGRPIDRAYFDRLAEALLTRNARRPV